MQEYLIETLRKALVRNGIETSKPITLEKPARKEFGDFSTNIALVLAKECGKQPRDLARELQESMEFRKGTVEKTTIAGPGFINFHLAPSFIMQSLEQVLAERDGFGRSCTGKGQKAVVEYVSANPTGPLTIGRGRGGVLGDCLANLLDMQGFDVTREYYFNDAGRQMTILGESVRLRYLEVCGQKVDYPETHYQGGYIREIARKLHDNHGSELADAGSTDAFKKAAETAIFTSIKNTLHRLNIHHDSFFNEHKLYLEDESGSSPNQQVIDALREKGFISEYDGATWFTTTKLGQEKNKVLIKSTGEPSYRLPDIAYHVTKFKRGFSEIVNVFGADHIDEYPDVIEALNILGYDGSRIRVAINQFVTTTVNGETVKMSTRKGNADLLDDLIDDVGADATRLFFIMRSRDSHLNFDVELAKKQSKDNPVFYLQYAHARICSLLKIAKKEIGFNPVASGAYHLQKLDSSHELQLSLALLDFPEVISTASRLLEPQKMVDYLHQVAELYHRFYQECPILKAEKEICLARLFLSVATRQVLRNGFRILGITAPETM
ncbi:arginine--tRNA ligase [Prosthecochloris vibrioformis]|uniref:Arginine--tRNA ligase n=1 Tax=Prosthecochloris vibrioformis TaxID=1098 RepID=A0A5C4S2J5_PROVB|nr:arginine--tRNA ligase [Prosthecochloris vibrioformis]TNJ37696.1 arginine--tRNA ligase [Prosthecochloris vibrioformis]